MNKKKVNKKELYSVFPSFVLLEGRPWILLALLQNPKSQSRKTLILFPLPFYFSLTKPKAKPQFQEFYSLQCLTIKNLLLPRKLSLLLPASVRWSPFLCRSLYLFLFFTFFGSWVCLDFRYCIFSCWRILLAGFRVWNLYFSMTHKLLLCGGFWSMKLLLYLVFHFLIKVCFLRLYWILFGRGFEWMIEMEEKKEDMEMVEWK